MLAASFLFLVIGLLVSTFLMWKLSRHLTYSEEQLFDVFFLTGLVSVACARLLFVILHFDIFGLHLIRWIAITVFPGLSFTGGLIGFFAGLYYWSGKYRLSYWRIADVYGVSFLSGVSLTLAAIGILKITATVDGAVYLTLPLAQKLNHPFTIVNYIALVCLLSVSAGLVASKKRLYKEGSRTRIMSVVLIIGLIGIDFLKEGRVYYTYITAEQLLLIALFFGCLATLLGTKISHMNTLTSHNSLNNILAKLTKEEETAVKEWEGLKKEDPFSDPEHALDNASDDTDAYEQSAHLRVESLEGELKKRIDSIRDAKNRIKQGTYGICQSCKKQISSSRLSVMPTTTLCIDCEKKAEHA